MNRRPTRLPLLVGLLLLAFGAGAFFNQGTSPPITPAYAAAPTNSSVPLPPIFVPGAVVGDGHAKYWIREVRGPWIRATISPSTVDPEFWIYVPASSAAWRLVR